MARLTLKQHDAAQAIIAKVNAALKTDTVFEAITPPIPEDRNDPEWLIWEEVHRHFTTAARHCVSSQLPNGSFRLRIPALGMSVPED